MVHDVQVYGIELEDGRLIYDEEISAREMKIFGPEEITNQYIEGVLGEIN